jgi:hypothetical protein
LPGPGSVRVGRWVGRLGVVSLPAVEVALSLDGRVVRRHVARLEAAGWLGRAAGVWGEGSVVWLTERGLVAVGLGGLTPLRASPAPSPTLTAHGVQVAWSAAWAERRGRDWSSGRELVLERERWEIRVRDERGRRRGVLPDLAVWRRADAAPVAVVIEPGYRRADRQRAILKAWRDAIDSGQYAAVRYDCAGEHTAQLITNLAKKLRLGRSVFLAAVQSTPEEIAAIEPEQHGQNQDQTTEHLPAAAATDGHEEVAGQEDSGGDGAVVVPIREPERRPVQPPPAVRPLAEQSESPEAAAEREQRFRAILGIPEPKPRRRWRR